MPLRRHEREGFIVSVEDEYAPGNGNGHLTRNRRVKEGHFARSNAGERGIEMRFLWPELSKVFLPDLDEFGRRYIAPFQDNPVKFLPHLTEALERSDHLASFHIQIQGPGRYARHFQC